MSPKSTNTPAISDELVMSKIYTVRGYKVMLDRDLAALYGVPTKALKQAVRRNMERFPEDFMPACILRPVQVKPPSRGLGCMAAFVAPQRRRG
jgi:hypothetical protein